MQTAIATVSLPGTLDEKAVATAAAGFRGIEIFENDLLSFSGAPAEIRRLVDGLGLRAIAFQPFRDFEGMPEPHRDRNFRRAERKFDVMQELGCDLLLVCSNVSPDALGGIDRAAADFHELGELAARRGLRIGFEALAWGRHINDYRDAWEAVRRADHPAVGLVLDSFHILARRTDLNPIRAIPKDRIFLVQLADAPLLDMDYLSWSRHYRCFPGQGDLDIDAFMAALLATGFDGLLSLEIFSDRFRAGSARRVAIDGQRSLLSFVDRMHRTAGAVVAGFERLPPPVAVEAIEFLEFAMDDASAAAFEPVLKGLGFAPAGVHKSKNVVRWRQDGINIIVNREKEGFAHSFNIMHGPSVCAIALRVADAVTAVERADRLLDLPFRQAVGPGELDIPAVRGVGGSLLYFIDGKTELGRWWEVDFRPVDGGAPPAGLTRFDHLSQSMYYEEMLSWLLFYTSLFDARKAPVLDVIDPGGVMQSQAVETKDGAVRLVLNASQSRQAMASRFVEDFFGSGVQQIALACDDIYRTVARLRASGVELLPIPDNYYDDLAVRTNLDDVRIERLRASNLMYDGDGAAEFTHAYTRTLPGGFFFEIVERRGGYRGYGAVNAPIRLAAQARLVRPLTV